MTIVKNRKIFYAFSVLLIALSFGALLVWGLKFGIDFTGGSLLEVEYTVGTPSVSDIHAILEDIGLQGSSVRPTGEHGLIIRTPFLTPEQYDTVKMALRQDTDWQYEEKQYSSIGPTIGTELQTK